MKDEKEIIKRIKFSLSQMAFGDIKRAYTGKSIMGAFILASCFIDYLSGFYYGHKADRNDYINFANKFLNKYNGSKLYYSMRNGLVHNYSMEKDFAFSHANIDGPNLGSHKSGRTIINLEDFIKDLETAMNKYFKALDRDVELKERALRRFKRGRTIEIQI